MTFSYCNKLKTMLLYVGLVLLVVFLTEAIAGSISRSIHFFYKSPKELALTVVGLMGMMVFLDSIFNRRYISILPMSALLFSLAWINKIKFNYLVEPLYPWDFICIHQIMDLLSVLIKTRLFACIALTLGLIIVIVLITAVTRNIYKCTCCKIESNYRRPIIGLLGFISVLCFGFLMTPYGKFLLTTFVNIQTINWNQNANSHQNGFILGFTLNMTSALIQNPAIKDDISIIKIAEAIKKNSRQGSQIRKHDVVIIMNESFWDPSKLPNLQMSPDPVPTVKKFRTGKIFSPVYGGGTANVEFEALTGFSNAFLPNGSVPYQQYIKAKTPSLIWALKAHGYRSIAIHPFDGEFWNRKNVYQHLGFDTFLAIEDMPNLPVRGMYASDAGVSNKIIEQLSKAKQPSIIFAVTMQNHCPYDSPRYSANRVKIKYGANIKDIDKLQTYTEGVVDADKGLLNLITWLKKRARPTLLMFFGDHLPALGDNYGLYRQTGYINNDKQMLSLDDYQLTDYNRMRETPFVIWSNQPGLIKKTGTVSPFLIPNFIINYLNIDHDFYGEFLTKLSSRFKVIDRRAILDNHGTWHEYSDLSTNKQLNEFHAIQHDIIFGKQASLRILFPEYDHEAVRNVI